MKAGFGFLQTEGKFPGSILALVQCYPALTKELCNPATEHHEALNEN